MVSSLGTSPLVSLPTMLGKKENTALFLVININAANDQGKQKSTFFMDSIVIKPEYYDTLFNKEGRKRFCRSYFYIAGKQVSIALSVLLGSRGLHN